MNDVDLYSFILGESSVVCDLTPACRSLTLRSVRSKVDFRLGGGAAEGAMPRTAYMRYTLLIH